MDLTVSLTSLADDSSGSLGKRAYDQLLEMMLNGELLPGTLLQERSLAERLGISRTPVREALARLETEGFVKRHSRRLVIVREMLVQEIMDILEVRSVLEINAIERATSLITAPALEQLRATFEGQMTSSPSNVNAQRRGDDLLHGLIVDAGNNVVLADIVRKLRQRTRMFNLNNLPERFVPGAKEHLAIVESLERRDVDAARRTMFAHFENVKLSILNRIART